VWLGVAWRRTGKARYGRGSQMSNRSLKLSGYVNGHLNADHM